MEATIICGYIGVIDYKPEPYRMRCSDADTPSWRTTATTAERSRVKRVGFRPPMCRDLNRDLRLLYESGPSDLTAYGLGCFLWV